MNQLREKARTLRLEYFPPSVHTKLLEWALWMREEVTPRLRAYHLMSPEFRQLFDQAWERYDKLESARSRHASCPRLGWQDGVEANMRDAITGRGNLYSPMTDEKLDVAPLSVYLVSTLRTPGKPEDRVYSWRTALDHWATFREHAASCSSFYRGLSEVQVSAFRILLAWWDSHYSDPKLLSAAKSFLESQREVKNLDFKAPYNTPGLASATGIEKSLYHSFCFRLFYYEFNPLSWEPFQSDVKLSALEDFRRQAAAFAISQRLAYSIALPATMLNVPFGDQYFAPVRADSTWLDDVDLNDKPFYLWDTEEDRTVCTQDYSVCPDYACVSHTWGRWRIENKVAEVPGALWPIPENKLYDVRNLPNMLKRLGERYVWFDLFCIPQYRASPSRNQELSVVEKAGIERAQIEISRQAPIFYNSKRCVAWINQCHSWKGVKNALAWLSSHFIYATTQKQDTFESKIVTQELSFLSKPAMDPVEIVAFIGENAIMEPDPWFTSLWTLQEAVMCPNVELYSRDWERLSILEDHHLSLTTLVVFLHTTMIYCAPGRLVDKASSFSSPTDHGLPRKGVSDFWKMAMTDWPSGPASLMGFLASTQLHTVLLDRTPMAVLSVAERRHYKLDRERSPAIMSAIGVSRWFRERLEHPSKSPEDSALLGNFSLAFVREAAIKIEAPFFSSNADYNKLQTSSGAGGPCGFTWGEGTMLPFSRLSSTTTTGPSPDAIRAYSKKVGRRDHESVFGWSIMADASVEMSFAGITCFSGMETPFGFSGQVSYWTPHDETWKQPTENVPRRLKMSYHQLFTEDEPAAMAGFEAQLEEGINRVRQNKIKSASPKDLGRHITDIANGGKLFAVALYEIAGKSHTGVLLAEIPGQLDPDPTLLVKVGHYWAWDAPLPPSTPVRWKVL